MTMKDNPVKHQRLDRLERREWHLWILVFSIVIIYVACIILLARSDVWYAVVKDASGYTFAILILGLFILTLLLCLYIVYQERQIKKLRREIFADERIKSMAQLAARISHDLNNKLAIASGFTELLLQSELPPDNKSDLLKIQIALQEMSRLMDSLMALGRQKMSLKQESQTDKYEIIDLSMVLKSVLDSMSHKITANHIAVEHNLNPVRSEHTQAERTITKFNHRTLDASNGVNQAKAGLLVRGSYPQLFEAFLNLVKNAVEAMAESVRKELTIKYELVNNQYFIHIGDSGSGIKPEVLKHLFELFVTSKPAGKGTGLGLNITRNIINRHKGEITAGNNPTAGATFTVALPAVQVKL